MSRRLLIAVMAAVLLWQTPALASLVITDRQQAATELTAGPRFFEYGSGQPVLIGAATDWDGVALEGLEVEAGTGHLVLGRAGDVAPTADPWHDAASTSRACEADVGSGVRTLAFDIAGEIAAERLRPDMADIRVYERSGGATVSFRTDVPTTSGGGDLIGGGVVVEVESAVCVYWGDPTAPSQSDASIRGPVVPDGGWSWSVWNDVGDGRSLDLVDWSVPSVTGEISSASVPNDVCNQCANEVVGFITPSVTGSYRLYLSADDVGRLELGPGQAVAEDPPAEDPPAEDPPAEDPPAEDPPAEDPPAEDPPAQEPPVEDPPAEDPPAEEPPVEEPPTFDAATLTTVVELTQATPIDVFTDPIQVSESVELVSGQTYAVRARSKDLEDGDHLQIAWALDGEEPVILPTDAISTIDGDGGSLTHRRFDLVETADRSSSPDSTTRIAASQNNFGTCDECAHSIGGYVVVSEAGLYRFWISSDDEGALLLSTSGNPAAATRVAWLTNFTDASNWTANPSQASAAVDLEAGQTIWLNAYNRDRGGPDHLQVGWSRVDTDPPTEPDLIPADQLSEAAPLEAALPSVELGPVEGQAATSGTFQSSAVDTSATGSNVFGLLFAELAVGSGGGIEADAGLSVTIEFADDPLGPWTNAAPLVDGVPSPLDADGRRYVRISGSLTSADTRIVSLGVERDLAEGASTAGVSQFAVPGVGDHYVFRVRGSIGQTSEVELSLSSTAGVAFWLAGAADSSRVDALTFDASGHHLGLTVDPETGPTSATSRWLAADGGGVSVVHEIVVVVEGA